VSRASGGIGVFYLHYEQTGLMNLMKGVFGTFRNPTAHEPQSRWPISEQDALDFLTMVSFLHRRIDNVHRRPRTGFF
jgi:uncharacterized protein (TIGR02391 family)